MPAGEMNPRPPFRPDRESERREAGDKRTSGPGKDARTAGRHGRGMGPCFVPACAEYQM